MTTSGEPRVLVVIPVLNEVEHLPGLLDQLLRHGAVEDCLIVVADGGSTDGSLLIVEAWMIRDARIRLHRNSRRLQSSGVNGAARTFGQGCRYLVRIDAHAVYPDSYVRGLVAAAERTGACSVVVPMRTCSRGGFQTAVAAAQNSRIGTGGAAHRGGAQSGWIDHGHHALMRLSTFNALGGYDEDFSHNEDAEYDIRLLRAGGRIWMQADLTIGYFPRTTPKALFRQYFNFGRGRARTVRLHKVRPRLRQVAPLVVAPALVAAASALLLSAVTPWALLAGLPALLWAGLCLAGGAAAAYRSSPRGGYAAGLAASIMHLAWSMGFWDQFLSDRFTRARARTRACSNSLPQR